VRENNFIHSIYYTLLIVVLWAIFTSIPQPLCAIPAYLFVEQFAPLLPGGLGFAAGAMSYVAIFELLVESIEDTASVWITGIVSIIAFMSMMTIQEAVKYTI
jgi:zinc transporter, ZIP family